MGASRGPGSAPEILAYGVVIRPGRDMLGSDGPGNCVLFPVPGTHPWRRFRARTGLPTRTALRLLRLRRGRPPHAPPQRTRTAHGRHVQGHEGPAPDLGVAPGRRPRAEQG